MKFSYFLPTKLSFGFGVVEGVGAEAAALGGTRALLVTDRVMEKTGTVDRVLHALGGLQCDVYSGVEPEPRIEAAQKAGDAARSKDYDIVIGLGGGSVMDMAKVAAGLATNEGAAISYVGNNLFKEKPLPSVMIPTTAGTGAELTVTSMVTVEGRKQWINSPLLLPSAALVDPELTMTMPPSVTAATGMDALCHNVEAYLSSLSSPITDSASLEGVREIVGNLEQAHASGADRKARESMSLGALMGGIALQAKMVYGHSIGYTLASRLKLPHGISCGIPLPYIIARYAVSCAPKMKKLADSFGVGADSKDPEVLGIAIAERVVGLLGSLGIATTLKEIGVSEGELGSLASECLIEYPRPNSPLVFDGDSMEGLYRHMWEGNLKMTG